MHSDKGFEELVLKNTSTAALKRFGDLLVWPPHLMDKYPNPEEKIRAAVKDYFRWSKGNWGIADFLIQCTEDEIPSWLRNCCRELRNLVQQTPERHEESGDATDTNTSEVSL